MLHFKKGKTKVYLFILFIDPLAPHKHLGFIIQRECAVILPEAVKQLHVFEVPVLVTH